MPPGIGYSHTAMGSRQHRPNKLHSAKGAQQYGLKMHKRINRLNEKGKTGRANRLTARMNRRFSNAGWRGPGMQSNYNRPPIN